jgi:hypothetical protein
MNKLVFAAIGLLALSSAACKKDSGNAEKGYPGPKAGDHVPVQPVDPGAGTPGQAATQQATGDVLETMDSGGYTYARMQVGPEEMWFAGPVTPLKVGDKVHVSEGTAMTDFHASSLDRTFKHIVFLREISVVGAGGGSAPSDPHAGMNTGGHSKPAPTSGGVTKPIAKADGGHTVEEVFAQKTALSGKQISVRGKVVKYNEAIMGRNWVHIQDGTGAAGTNDLLVTSSATTKVGDVVVAKGTLALDQDFGAGYNYDVVLENATFTTE